MAPDCFFSTAWEVSRRAGSPIIPQTSSNRPKQVEALWMRCLCLIVLCVNGWSWHSRSSSECLSSLVCAFCELYLHYYVVFLEIENLETLRICARWKGVHAGFYGLRLLMGRRHGTVAIEQDFPSNSEKLWIDWVEAWTLRIDHSRNK